MFGPNTTKNKATEQVDAFWLELSLKLGQISNGHIEAISAHLQQGKYHAYHPLQPVNYL